MIHNTVLVGAYVLHGNKRSYKGNNINCDVFRSITGTLLHRIRFGGRRERAGPQRGIVYGLFFLPYSKAKQTNNNKVHLKSFPVLVSLLVSGDSF